MANDEQVPLDPSPSPAGDLSADLDKALRQIADYKGLIADFDNSRKRLIQDAERQRKYAAEPLAKDLIATLDNLDRALEAAAKAGETGPLTDGVKATVSLFLDILKRHGVSKMDVQTGTVFDPNRHQAVLEQVSAEVAAGAVVQVLQPGFALHDRVLRPASVIVAKSADE